MSNYFDNQSEWSWTVIDDKVYVTTDHGNHTHTLDVTGVPIGEMAENTGQVMGDAHRMAGHDMKETTENEAVPAPAAAVEDTPAMESGRGLSEEEGAELEDVEDELEI